MNHSEPELAALLRSEERLLDDHTVARIATARRRALAAPRPAWIRRWYAPVAGTAVLAGVLGIAVLLPPQNAAPERPRAEKVAENPEFYQDLDFYLWLADSEMGSHG